MTSEDISRYTTPKYTPVALLTQQSRRWSSKVLVVEKSHRRSTKLSGKEYQRYIFVDESGTHIQAMSYTPDITTVDTVLQPFQTYIISNAKILPCNIQYRIVNNPFQWVLTTSTSMELAMDLPLPHSLVVPTFTAFSELHQHKSTDTNLNILAIVLDTSNSRYINGIYGPSTVQDLVLITEEKIPMLLSCWNDIITSEAAAIIKAAPSFPIMAGLRLRTQEYQGLSLAAKESANLILDPPYSNAESLKTWQTANQDFLANLTNQKHYFTQQPSHKFNHHTQATSIAEMINSDHAGHFTITGHLSLPPEEQEYYYMSWPSCFHNTTANPGMHFTCRNCHKQDRPKPRARCTITISDNLTQLGIVAFGEVATKIIGISALDLLQMDTEETPINLSTIKNTLANNTYEIHVRKKTSSWQYSAPFYYNLIDYKLATNKGPNTPDHCPTKRTTTPTTTHDTNTSTSHQGFTEQLTTNKTPRLSSNALLQRATTTVINQGPPTETSDKIKEHNA